MSKSKGNTVEPWQVLDTYGADAFRWYFFTSKQPWDGYRFSAETIGEGVRLFLKQLWSTYYFYSLYAHASADQLAERRSRRGKPPGGRPRPLGALAHGRHRRARDRAPGRLRRDLRRPGDRRARRGSLQLVRAPLAPALLGRRCGRPSRRCARCLLTVARLLAPFCPFIADEIYDNLDGTLASVHLCDFPDPGSAGDESLVRDTDLEQAMALARETVRLGLRRPRQGQDQGPPAARRGDRGRRRARAGAIERLADVVREELNVKRVRFVAAAEELGSYEVKANYRTLGPLFGKADAAGGRRDRGARPGQGGRRGARRAAPIGIDVGGREHTLSAEDVILTMRAPEGYSVEREGAHAVALDLTIDEELREEGYAREIVHAVQNARKSAGLQVEDRIELALGGDAALLRGGRGPPRLHRRRDPRRRADLDRSGRGRRTAPAVGRLPGRPHRRPCD